MDKRSVQKQKTRQNILEAAYCLFGSKGILGTRMQDVAEAAGVSHGAVFMHFKTQEALVSAVIEDFGGKVAMRTHELAAGQTGVRGVLGAHLQMLADFEDFYCRLIAEMDRLPAVCRDQFVVIQSAVSLHLSQAAEGEMRQGTVRRMPVHLLFNTWVGLVHYYLLNRSLFAPGKSVIRLCGQDLLEHFISLIQRED